MNRAYLRLAATIAGASTMGVEIAALRWFAPTFGQSVYVWGALVAVLMSAMAAGYATGGRLADRRADASVVGALVLVAGALQAIGLTAGATLLEATAGLGDALGTALCALVLVAPGAAASAAVAPVAMRAALADRPGAAIGDLSALGTLGGVLGIAVTAFVLLPNQGTFVALATWCALSLAIGALGAATRWRAAGAALLVVPLLPFAPWEASPEGVVYAADSPYNRVWVVREGDVTALYLNDARSLHTVMREGAWTGMYYDDLAFAGVLAERAERALVLGLGGGASVRTLRAVAPQIEVDAVEIDPDVVDVAERFFGLDRADPHLRVHVADARPWLRHDTHTYDVIELDLYAGGPYVPFYLTTVEFHQLVAKRVAPGGVVAMNVFDAGVDRDIVGAVAATLAKVYPSVYVLGREGGNHAVFAFPEPTDSSVVAARVRRATGEVAVRVDRAFPALRPMAVPADAVALTDDRAPIEALTRSMLDGLPASR